MTHGSAVLLLRFDLGVMIFRDDNCTEYERRYFRKDNMHLDGEKTESRSDTARHVRSRAQFMMKYARNYGMDGTAGAAVQYRRSEDTFFGNSGPREQVARKTIGTR
jgi:hypothetical protein